MNRGSSLNALAIFIGLSCGASLTGCFTAHNNATRRDLPEDWASALEHPAATPADFAGTYSNAGILVFKGLDSRQSLAKHRLINGVTTDVASLAFFAGYPPNAPGAFPPASTVELVVTGGEKLEMIVRVGATEMARRSWSITWEPANGALVLEDEVKPGGSTSTHAMGAAIGWKSVRLFMGSDGALYLQDKKGMVAALMFVIPIAERDESWGRWERVKSQR
jgi:hypothetical protein